MDLDSATEYFTKKILPNLKKNNGRERDWKGFHPAYLRSVRQAERLRPHCDAEYYPEKLFSALSPHQRSDEAKWLKDNYEPFTIPVYIDFMNTIKRGTNHNNYSIAYTDMPEEYKADDRELKTYLNTGIGEYGSIEAWFTDSMLEWKIKDANSVVAVLPKDGFTEVDEEGRVVIREDVMIEPVPVIYGSDRVLAYESDVLFTGISAEHSMIKTTGPDEKTGLIIDIYTPTMIYKAVQVGRKSDWKFEVREYYPHEWERLPAWPLKGVPHEIDGGVMYYQSPYYYALAALNTTLKNKNILEMTNANVAFPYRIMLTDECDFKGDDGSRCLDGQVTIAGTLQQCPACGGSGMKNKPSAGGTLLVQEVIGGEQVPNMDRIRFVAPDTAILTWMETKAKNEEIRAREILHLRTATDQANGSDPTATGRLVDQQSMYAFIMPIVNSAFETFGNVVSAITYMRYAEKVEAPKVTPPVNLDFMTSADYLDEYKTAVTTGAPPIVIRRFMERYVKSLFYGSETEEKMWKLVLSIDELAAQSNDEVRALKGANLVTSWQAVLHISIFKYIADAMAEDKDFLIKPIDQQQKVVVDKARLAAAELAASTTRSQIVEEIGG